MIRSLTLVFVVACAVWFGSTLPARAADFIDGAQLARACASKAPSDSAACGGYVAGALDEVIGSADLRAKICPPPATKLSVLREALGRYGQQHPDQTKGSGIALLHAMMTADYPCPAK